MFFSERKTNFKAKKLEKQNTQIRECRYIKNIKVKYNQTQN